MDRLFSREDIRKLIIPLVIEQLLAVSIGLVDTLMVSSVGEAAVSGVSLVDSISTLVIQILSALATGGAVVCSQYLGKKEAQQAKKSAAQLMLIMLVFSGAVMILILFSYDFLLRAIFGKIEADVMRSAEVYFVLAAISYPFLGIYNAGAALFRAMGNSKISMYNSLIMNILNIGGNAILIFGFKMGVLGAATSTLISRVICCMIMTSQLCRKTNPLCIRIAEMKPDRNLIGKILGIGIPSGIENGMFQIGKLAVSSLASTFGTAAIAGNAIANNIASFANIPGNAIGLSMITVVGRCIGAGEKEQAKYYSRRLLLTAYIGIWMTNAVLAVGAGPIASIFGLSAEAKSVAVMLLHSFCICAVVLWPLSFTVPNILRAAGDAKYTMKISVFSMWVFRVASSYLIAGYLGVGILGVWIGMYIDWFFRSIFFVRRYVKGKWLERRVV